MISSSAHAGKWVLPKGGHEKDETLVETAMRETWEEAGVEGVVVSELPMVLDSRTSAPVIKGDFDPKIAVPKSEFHFFELIVDKMDQEWPESTSRQRRWCTYSEAKHELIKAKRPELVTALNSSSIIKDASESVVDKY
ncbi:Diphosphoinositol polyphosphate phosphohydrolase DDP1 [Spathaspora sp. JA1]|nr:Diphosphoinositol polyphosphate phosphohydrolase DDP1 [Spathaspora sp. JA1]